MKSEIARCKYIYTFATEKFPPNVEITLCAKFFDATDCRYHEPLDRIVEVAGDNVYGYCHCRPVVLRIDGGKE